MNARIAAAGGIGVFIALAASSCWVPSWDPNANTFCNAAHPCVAGFDCVSNQCRAQGYDAGNACFGTPYTCGARDCFSNPCLDDGGCEAPRPTTGAACDGGLCRNDGVCISGNGEIDCSDGVDNNQDQLKDCEDPSCGGVACSSNPCISAKCQLDGGCVGPPVTCAPPGECHSFDRCDPVMGCKYAIDAGALCNDNDLCTVQDSCTAQGFCAGAAKNCNSPGSCQIGQGTCNPSDGACVYNADVGGSCSDNNACTEPDSCNASATCMPGPPLSCPAPAACRWPAPCKVDAGCQYIIDAGASCDDGLSCTQNDTCNGSGTCVGAVSCNTPRTTCYDTPGNCSAGGCQYTVNTSKTCVADGNPCTIDSCAANGDCQATPYTCTPGECQLSSTCNGTGGCTTANKTNGTGCSNGGVCQSGACIPFSYLPSNFDAAQIGAVGHTAAVVIDCNAWFNTTDNSFSWCAGSPMPTITNITQNSGGPAVVLAMASLTVNSTRSLTFYGSKPVILAVWGNVTVAGTISARSVTGALAGAGSVSSGACVGFPGASHTTAIQGGGGGGGGGCRIDGGAGGDAQDAPAAGGAGGAMFGNLTLNPLVGGCKGGAGGLGNDSDGVGAAGGAGGGALRISATGNLSLILSGTITASAQGGTHGASGADDSNGGGGGGSGGGVLLEADIISMTNSNSAITANGGGGGSGSSSGGQPGSNGQDGSATGSGQAQGGPGGTSTNGNGGDGASLGGIGGMVGESHPSSGGGGGGSDGHIRMNAATTCTVTQGVRSPQAHGGGVCLATIP